LKGTAKEEVGGGRVSAWRRSAVVSFIGASSR
jgi:hypothetical protein